MLVRINKTTSHARNIYLHPNACHNTSPTHTSTTGQKIVALVETALPICVERFVDYPQLGRFTLRDEGRTVAIGKVRGLRDAIIFASLLVSGR